MTKFYFFKEAVSNIKTIGSFLPSSKYLTKKLLHNIDFKKAKVLIEFGPGNGILTKNIIKKLSPNAKLICFEINNNFYNKLNEINNPQLIILNCSADNVASELKKLEIEKVDGIISGLPLSNISKIIGESIIKESYTILNKGAYYIQYQYSLNHFKRIKKAFKNNVVLSFEFLNVPPAVIYTCKK